MLLSEEPHQLPSVMLQRVGLDGRRRVVQSVRVVCGLAGQRARVGQRSCTAVAEEPAGTEKAGLKQREGAWPGAGQHGLPVMPYKLHIVALVALFDAVDADGVPVCGIAGVTPGERTQSGRGGGSDWSQGPLGGQLGRGTSGYL